MKRSVSWAVLGLLVAMGGVAMAEEAPGEDSEAPAEVEVEVVEEEADVEGADVEGATRLTMLVTGNLDGNLAQVNCREEGGYTSLYWARQAAYVDTLRDLSGDSGLVEPLYLSTGDSLFPGVLARYLLSMDETGARTLADLLTRVPVEVHGLGSREFTVDRGDLLHFVEAMRERGVAMQAANLACEGFGSGEGICDALGGEEARYQVIEREGVRIAVTTVLATDLLDRLASSQREGVRILDSKEVLPGLVAEMREDADLVVVQHQLRGRHALERSYELATEVEGIDLMIANFLFEDERAGEGPAAVVHASRTGTPIVSGNSGPQGLVELHLVVSTGDRGRVFSSVKAKRVDLTEMPEHRPTRELLASSVEAFCEDWGDPLGAGANLSEEMEMADLQAFVLNVMRFSTRSEVALINTGAFRDDGQFPLTGALTSADLYMAMPFENRLVTARVSGARLKALALRLTEGALVAQGMEVQGDRVLINGRPVDDARLYPVVVNDFLAEGGDGVFGADHLTQKRVFQPEWADGEPTADNVVIRYVSEGMHLADGREREGVAPQANFADLHRKFLWTFQGSVNASYNQVAVQNPLIGGDPGYDQGQLTVQATDQINMEGRFATQADSRNHRWNNDLNLQYATARLRDLEDATFEKTRDQIRLRSRYRYQRLRVDRDGRWFIPDPMLEGQVETEFDQPETRDWHRVDLRAIAGVSFLLSDPLDFRLGMNVRQDVNQPDSEPTWGLTAGYTLARVRLVNIMERPVHFESEVEYFYNEIGSNNVHEIRSGNRLFYSLFGQLFFTTTFNVFAVRNDAVGEFGTNTELTLGLNYQWDGSLQRF